MKKYALILAIAIPVLVVIILTAAVVRAPYCGDGEVVLLIDTDDTPDSVLSQLRSNDVSTFSFRLLSHVKQYRTSTGRYVITSKLSGLDMFRKIRNAQQDPLNVVVPSVRTMDRLASALSAKLMLDSATIHNHLCDSAFLAQYGYSRQTLPALFIPNTYQIFWDSSMDKLMQRMVSENKRFWSDDRLKKAASIGLSTTEVCTLASIVDEETANSGEKPMVAEMYLNRLQIGMMLQADPTVKVAVGDWSLRRILNKHLQAESPYNTYKHTGLPPGPIRIASIDGIDAVLNHASHDYLYMCAKEDFSGTHNFATTYDEHLRNARRYINALNMRGIK